MHCIQTLPNSLKPRELLSANGAASLNLSDLLAVIIGTGNVEHSVLEVSREVANLLSQQPVIVADLQTVKGVGIVRPYES